MFRSPPPPTPSQPGTFALGKYAGYAEFVRADDDAALERFEGWIDEGMMEAHERWGEAWRADFTMGVAHGFLWCGPRGDDARLCGVIAPSRDSVGRDYPLAVLARVSQALIARAPHVVPLAFGAFLDDAYATVADARVVPMSPAQLRDRVRALQAAGPNDLLRAEHEYGTWCRETRLEDAWSAIFPVADPVAAAAHTLDALVTIRGQEQPDTNLLIRLPLGNAGAAAAAVWIDIVRRITHRSATSPSAFWAVDAGALLIAPGAVPRAALAELWHPDPSNGIVFDPDLVDSDEIPPSGFRELASEVREGAGATSMLSFLETVGTRAACDRR